MKTQTKEEEEEVIKTRQGGRRQTLGQTKQADRIHLHVPYRRRTRAGAQRQTNSNPAHPHRSSYPSLNLTIIKKVLQGTT